MLGLDVDNARSPSDAAACKALAPSHVDALRVYLGTYGSQWIIQRMSCRNTGTRCKTCGAGDTGSPCLI